jgi:hypothetical protein
VKSLGWPPGTITALGWLPLYLPRVKKAGMPRREKQETAKRAKSSDGPVCFMFATDQSANAQTGRAVTREVRGRTRGPASPALDRRSKNSAGSGWDLRGSSRQPTKAVDVAWPVEMVGAHGACASRLRRRSWSYVDEAGDGLEAAVLADDAEVGADEVGRRILRPAGFPREADAVVVGVDHAGQPETIGWETLLDGLDHRIDGLVTVPAPVRIDIVPFLGPRAGDQDPTATRVLLVPGG